MQGAYQSSTVRLGRAGQDLNWSPARKALSTACMCVYTLMVGIASAAIYSVLVPISDSTGLTLADLNAGTGYMFLAFGWGCLFWQPLALQYGKRPVYLISILATLGIQVWAPSTTSNGQWIANKVLQGFFGAPIESLCEISVTDIYFQHERGAYIALYALLLAGSNFVAPVFAGFIADGQGWKWVLYWCAIFCAIGFVFLFFFMEETNYNRAPIVGLASEPQASSLPASVAGDDEKRTPASADVEAVEPLSENTVRPKTYLDKLKLWQEADIRKPNQLGGFITRPLKFLTFPVIAYAGFSYAWAVGLSYLCPLVGVAIGSVYTGWIGDRIVLNMARRNNGVLEAEHRLWLFLPSLLLIPFGLILWGVGAAHAIQWFGEIFAMGIIAITNTIGLQLSVSYCIDSYKDLSGEAMVTVILVRNTMSFAVGYGLTPWVTDMGLQNAFILAAFVGMAQCATFLILVKYGKELRRKSAPGYAKYVEKVASSGMLH
ncbi:hypothetical protein B0A54_02749 [Friedmanniomyces endolithicus]|uniref:Major facilitator superfamily (MFS) profile domain-containing protein n=1 Tax=Friedmanniomyces endolithicus TaxID=329885 RepID=A0A4U0VDY5_9PEZI|nr:hypothetical protein B0A54_02749 [Friedmanniomyces endolithicus]